MSDGQQNATQLADNATAGAEVLPMASELGPNGLPIHPPAGDEGDRVDHDMILDTFFGEGQQNPNSEADQTKGPNASGSQTQTVLAPGETALAANGDEGGSQSGPSSTQQDGQQQGTEGGGAAQTPGQQQSSSPEPQPSSGLSAEDRLRLASAEALAEQNRQLLDRLARLEGGQQGSPQTGQQQGQPGGAGQQSGAQMEPVHLTVPDNLAAAIFADDPGTAKQAMDVLISAVATNAVSAALQRVVPIIDQRLGAVMQTVQAGEQVGKMEEAYYQAFPDHKNELYKPLIQATVDEKYKLFPHAQWDENMINAVGASVTAKLKALGISSTTSAAAQTEQNGQQQQQNGQQRQQPAPMLDGGTRAGSGVPQDAGDFISSTFG